MSRDFYGYNKNLIKELGYFDLIKKYNFSNIYWNEAIFYAISTFDKHIKVINNKNIGTEDILLGDYFSFEFYGKLKEDLSKLFLLSECVENKYSILSKEVITVNDIVNLATSVPKVFFNEYKIKVDERELEYLVEKFYFKYSEVLEELTNEKIDLTLLIDELRKSYNAR